MYIPEFWCGVVTVVIIEVLAVIGAAIAVIAKKKK